MYQKIDPLCKVMCVAKFEPILAKNVLNLSVISSLCSLLLSINTSDNLLMRVCFLQIDNYTCI